MLELMQGMRAIELIRRAGIDMRQRQIGCMVRRDSERHADQLRVHHIQSGGFGIHADQFGGEYFFQPCVELRFGQYRFIVRAVGAGGRVVGQILMNSITPSPLQGEAWPVLSLSKWGEGGLCAFLTPSPTLSLIHISEPTRLGMTSYAVFCLKKKK